MSFGVQKSSVKLGWLFGGLRMCCDGCPGPKMALNGWEHALCMRCSICAGWSWLSCVSFILHSRAVCVVVVTKRHASEMNHDSGLVKHSGEFGIGSLMCVAGEMKDDVQKFEFK